MGGQRGAQSGEVPVEEGSSLVLSLLLSSFVVFLQVLCMGVAVGNVSMTPDELRPSAD